MERIPAPAAQLRFPQVVLQPDRLVDQMGRFGQEPESHRQHKVGENKGILLFTESNVWCLRNYVTHTKKKKLIGA